MSDQYSETENSFLEQGFKHWNDNVWLAYATDQNVFNAKLYTEFDKAFLHPIAFIKLDRARELLAEYNSTLHLVLVDALRPYSIQQRMWDTYSGENKENYIANPKSDSMHNYGIAVDVWLQSEIYDLDFGCNFDEFSERAHIDSKGLTLIQKDNRNIMREVMTKAGFLAYDHEFWHYEAMDKDWVRQNCKRID